MITMLRKNYTLHLNEDEMTSLCNLLLTIKVHSTEPTFSNDDLTEMDRRAGREILAALCKEAGR